MKTREELRGLKHGDIVLCTFDNGAKKYLYEFGYYNATGGCVVYKEGERNMQDSYSFRLEQVKLASPDEIAENYYGT